MDVCSHYIEIEGMDSMRRYMNGVVWCAVMTAVAVALSCSGKSSSGPGDNGDGDTIKTGAAATYQVSGGAVSVKDSVSGVTFLFPEGGNGTLKVAQVISGPDVGVPAARVAVEYAGSGSVAITVPHTEGNEEVVYIRGKIPNVVSVQGAQAGGEAWLGVPPSEKRADATV